jgi:two-component system sensor histidine kinase HydH
MERWLEQYAAAVFASAAELTHDLKTPLNIAVLNLELLRMRLNKTGGTSDEKIGEYSRAVEVELRRMAQIFDAYFTYAAPPRNEPIGAVSLRSQLGSRKLPGSWQLGSTGDPATVTAHPSRIVDLLNLLISASGKIFSESPVVITTSTDHAESRIRLEGTPSGADTDIAKVFKFYYTDASGTPDIGFATARLIAETYGGTLTLWQENGNRLVLELRLPAAAPKNES